MFQRKPVFVLVYGVPATRAKLVVEVNTPLKKAGRIMNSVVSGRLVTTNQLVTDIGRGVLVVDGIL